ncbi:MAG: glucosaminidase domain-containing protein [Hyphomicrobiaceae bacterium]|nr:glucosaminidase domain-containing protein [Hyphomicrobiaceae bacterium]
MLSRVAAAALAASAFSLSATASHAAELPAILAEGNNTVPECATPGRLTAFLAARNARLDARYRDLAVHYMRHGESLGIRWDIAFFQMLLETGNLTYTGDVDPEQNNFAGLGATGSGVKGESFSDVATGVRAHLEHVTMYSGRRVENAVAERTRNVQAWGVLTKWQKSFDRPLTFADLARKWAPGSKGYARDVAKISSDFYDDYCRKPDPHPEMLAAARGDGTRPAATAAVTKPDASEAGSSADLAAAALARAKAEAADRATPVAQAPAATKPQAAPAATAPTATATAATPEPPAAPGPKVTVLNSTEPAAPPAGAATGPDKEQKVAMAAGAATGATAAPAADKSAAEKPKGDKAASGKCRVWTASYGGAKAIIIKAMSDGVANYTVLDVNAGREQREADAYIAAYAKGGTKIAEFSSPSAALDKAFELCPEG